MRDPKRIKRMQDKIAKLWKRYPDQRWGQFLINNGLIIDDNKIWNREDDELEKELDRLLRG